MTTDRRDVLKVVAGAAAAAAIADAARAQAPARPYRVGVIGAGWFGKLNLNALMQVAPVEAVALCDVDRRMLEEARALTRARADSVAPQRRAPAIYRDYRQMLAAHEFDIVIVGTPDHWHALQTIAALERGAHVYVEKPVCVDIVEGRAMVAAARRAGKVVQVGTQRRVAPFLIEARDRVVRPGLLGKVAHVEVFGYFHQRLARTSAATAPPHTLDWDFYCGPAALQPYYPELHPRNWRSFEPFGNGYMGDIGVHFIDACRALLDLGWPKRVWSAGGALNAPDSAATVPDTQIAGFEFDNLLMTWTNRHWGRAPDPANQWGAAIHGDLGTLRIYTSSYEFLPRAPDGQRIAGAMASELQQFPSDRSMPDWEQGLQAITRHNMRDFLAAIASGARPASDIEQGHISTGCCILANMSRKLARSLAWDGDRQRVVGDDAANALLARAYRAPWVHPTGEA
jgi:predicted dehydrogenase